MVFFAQEGNYLGETEGGTQVTVEKEEDVGVFETRLQGVDVVGDGKRDRNVVDFEIFVKLERGVGLVEIVLGLESLLVEIGVDWLEWESVIHLSLQEMRFNWGKFK